MNRFHDFLSCVVEVVCADNGEVGFGDELLTKRYVSAFEANNEWDVKFKLSCCCEDAFCNDVTLHDATKDVHQDTFDLRVRKDDLERCRNLLFSCPTSYVEEVCWITTEVLDDVHCCHC